MSRVNSARRVHNRIKGNRHRKAETPAVPAAHSDAQKVSVGTTGGYKAASLVGGAEYHPHVADNWDSPGYSQESSRNVFPIHASDETGKQIFLIATITVNPAINAKSAHDIANLMSFAPELWQSLQKEYVGILNDAEKVEEAAEVEALLWAAAGIQPFTRDFYDDDADLFYEMNSEAVSGKKASPDHSDPAAA